MSNIEKVIKARDQLLKNARALLVTVASPDGAPDIGSSPFWRDENGCIYIYTSHLSAHVRGLLAGRDARYLIIADESQSQNIWARVRLNFQSDCQIIERHSDGFYEMIPKLEQAFGPTMSLIKSFEDFHLLKLTPKTGTLVTGFAAAFAVSGPSFDIGAQVKTS